MMSALVDCPCCGSKIRIELDAVTMTKPAPPSQLTLAEGKLRPVGVDQDEAQLAVASLERFAARAGVSLELLRGPSRSQHAARLRQAAMWTVRTEAAASYALIGRLLERDHSTVIHGVRAHERRRAA